MAHPLAEVQNFTYSVLSKELDLNAKEKESQCLLDAYLDDFWQKGVTLLPPASGGHSSDLSGVFERRYVFRNVIKEVVGRVVGAFYGKAPNWRYQANGEDLVKPELKKPGTIAPPVPPPPEGGPTPTPPPPTPEEPANPELTEIDKALSNFFVRQNVADEMGKALAFRLAFGRGSWRLYIPVKYKRQNKVAAPGDQPDVMGGDEAQRGDAGEETEYVKFPSIADAIAAMRLEFVLPTQGRLLDDEGEYFSLVKYEVRENWESNDTVNVIEFSFVDNSDRTFIGTVGERSTISKIIDANLSSPFDLAGLTTLGEFKGQPYVTKALFKNNQLLNLALTCAGFNLVDNGFGEMVLTNVALATKTETGPDGEKQEVPVDIKRGGGAVQNFVGIDQVDESTGAVTKATPGVTFREPSAMTTFKDGAELAYVACLHEAGQLYALISGDATASGESRVQALADFVLKISPYKSEVDEQGSWLMTVVLLWAAELAGKPLTGYKVVYDSRMFVAALSNEEKNTVMQMRKNGTISRETERVLLGIDDPGLENELILREQAEPADTTPTKDLSERADLALKLQGIGFPQDVLYKILGVTDEQIKEIKDKQAEEQAALEENIRKQTEAAGAGTGAF